MLKWAIFGRIEISSFPLAIISGNEGVTIFASLTQFKIE